MGSAGAVWGNEMIGAIKALIAELLRTRGDAVPVVLDLGCGARKRAGAIGIDRLQCDDVDIVGDVTEVLKSFPNESIDEIVSNHFVEHVENFEELLEEMFRVLRRGGGISVVAPHFSNPYYYSDYTHRRFFGLYSFCYTAQYDSRILKRRVPQYRKFQGLILVSVNLVFKTSRPFYLRYLLERFAGLVFNSNRMMKELYERAFCYWWPCYELHYVLRKEASAN